MENLMEEETSLDAFKGPDGQVDATALTKAYTELAEKVKHMVKVPDDTTPDVERQAFYRAIGVPESPEQYQITCQHQLLSSDPEVNALLYQQGFTNQQVQAVYDLAATKILPIIEELAADYESDKQRAALVRHFGGEEQWNTVSRQLSLWAKQNVPEPVLKALSGTYEGVMTLYTMMQNGEPTVMREGPGAADVTNEAGLQKMMMDPKYWKEQDPDLVRRVTEGFQRLYPSK